MRSGPAAFRGLSLSSSLLTWLDVIWRLDWGVSAVTGGVTGSVVGVITRLGGGDVKGDAERCVR